MGKVLIPNGAQGEEAVYREQVIKEYGGNPFIEALPPLYAPEEVVEKLAVYPYYSEEERNLDARYRIHLTQKLFQCFQPLPSIGFGKQDFKSYGRDTCRNPVSKDM